MKFCTLDLIKGKVLIHQNNTEFTVFSCKANLTMTIIAINSAAGKEVQIDKAKLYYSLLVHL